jgi:hypothetical protein
MFSGDRTARQVAVLVKSGYFESRYSHTPRNAPMPAWLVQIINVQLQCLETQPRGALFFTCDTTESVGARAQSLLAATPLCTEGALAGSLSHSKHCAL